MKQMALILSFILSAVLANAAEDSSQASKVDIDSACASEAKAAECGKEKVAKDLVTCLQAYKGSNHAFEYSAPCKAALEKKKATSLR
jgi:hypothetical protein